MLGIRSLFKKCSSKSYDELQRSSPFKVKRALCAHAPCSFLFTLMLSVYKHEPVVTVLFCQNEKSTNLIMFAEVDVFISNYTLVDPELYQLWIEGYSCKYDRYIVVKIASDIPSQPSYRGRNAAQTKGKHDGRHSTGSDNFRCT